MPHDEFKRLTDEELTALQDVAARCDEVTSLDFMQQDVDTIFKNLLHDRAALSLAADRAVESAKRIRELEEEAQGLRNFLRAEKAGNVASERELTEAIQQRDHYQKLLGDAAIAAGCTREFTSAHDHSGCVSEAFSNLEHNRSEWRDIARRRGAAIEVKDAALRPLAKYVDVARSIGKEPKNAIVDGAYLRGAETALKVTASQAGELVSVLEKCAVIFSTVTDFYPSISAERDRYRAALEELRAEYLSVQDPKREVTFKWSLTRIGMALEGGGE